MKIWVHIDGRQLGPYAPDQLPVEEMDATTPVWYDGLQQWTPAGEAPLTAAMFLPPAVGDLNAENDSETATPPAGEAAPEETTVEADTLTETVQTEGVDAVDEQQETVTEQQGDAAEPAAPEAPEVPGMHPQYNPRPRNQFYPPQEEQEKCPPTYLVWSILLTICCCNPLGVIPIITGAQVNSRYNNMDFEGARRSSYITEWWVIICFVLGLMMIPFNLVIYL